MARVCTLTEIKKRDGRIVDFDRSKIAQAILKAAQAVQGSDDQLADALAERVIALVESESVGQVPEVEAIQDAIEKVLIESGHARTAKAFILYRARRSRIREGKSELMDAVAEILQSNPAPHALPENKLLAIGSAASREYHLNRQLPESLAEAHLSGKFHVHGLSLYAQAPQGFVAPLGHLLSDGFARAHVWIRPPKRAASAAALVGIIAHALQTEGFGGVSFARFDQDLARVLPAETSFEDLHQAMEALVFALNAASAPNGKEPPSVTIQIGLAADPLGRMVAETLLRACLQGLGRGEVALRPHLVYQLRDGVNLRPGDPNADLTRLAAELAGSRKLVTFVHDPEDGVYLGHEGRLSGEGRSLVARVTLNLPRLAMESKRSGVDLRAAIDQGMSVAIVQLRHRFEAMAKRRVAEFPFAFGQGLHHGSRGLAAADAIAPALHEGSLLVGVIGLAEALTVLHGAHHGDSPSAQAEGLQLIKALASRAQALSAEFGLRVALHAGDAGHVGERFARLDRREFGIIKGVTDQRAYSEGVRLPTQWAGTPAERLAIEGAYAASFAGGCFHVTPFPAAIETDAALGWLAQAVASGQQAFALDFPLSGCPRCGRTGPAAGDCTQCETPETLQRAVVRRRGYLAFDEA